MNGALSVAKTGMSAQDTNLTVISNNLANATTVGFKKDRAVFEDLMYQTLRQPGAQSGADTQLPSGLQLGTGVRTVATQKIHTDGEFTVTENDFDFAITGKGFFQVQQPSGDIAYTRNGQFGLDGENRLVTAEGLLIEPEITLPSQVLSFSVSKEGNVSVITAVSAPFSVELPQILVASFVNPQGLVSIGQNLYVESTASGAPLVAVPGQDGTGFVSQGVVEGSNVNAVEELVNLITTQRAYEINSKVVSAADEMLSYINQQL